MNPLEQLRDIHLPDPVGWWPPAPGWWLLGLTILGLLVWALHRLQVRYRRDSFRRQALRELDALCRHQPLPLPDLLQLARRTALSANNNPEIASTSSYNLLNLIINNSKFSPHNSLHPEQLANRLYQPSPQPLGAEESRLLCACIRTWIKQFKGNLPC